MTAAVDRVVADLERVDVWIKNEITGGERTTAIRCGDLGISFDEMVQAAPALR